MPLPLAFSIHHFISSVGADAGFAAIIGLAVLVLLYFAQARETTTLRDEAISASQRVEQLERRVSQLGGPPVAPAPESAVSNPRAGTSAAPPDAPAGAVRVGPARAVANPVATASPGAGSPATAAGSNPGAPGADRAPLPQAPTPGPAAPAGVGAPALADATRLIPAAEAAQAATGSGQPGAATAKPASEASQTASEASQPAAETSQPAPETSQPAVGAASPAPEAARAQAETRQPAAEPAEPAAEEPRAGATEPAAGTARDAAPPPETQATHAAALATPPPATAAAGAGQAQAVGESRPGPVAANGGGDPARPRTAAASPPRPAPPRIQIRDGSRAPGSLSLGAERSPTRWLPALVGVLLLAVVIAVLLVVTSGGGSSHHAAATRSTNAPALKGGFSPAAVTVAVLNGTDVSQLAHRVQQKLTRTGFKAGAVATAADQTHSTTVVAYMPGSQGNATHVASSLGLPSSSVQPVDQSARAIACPPATACAANVVVTVGSDLASTR